MRGVIGSKVQDVDHRILVLNWMRRKGMTEKEEEVNEKKWEEEELL